MRSSTFVITVAIIFTLTPSSLAGQTARIRKILRDSRAELVFVGKADGMTRGYTVDGSGDDTEVAFTIQKLLKGKYRRPYITFRFDGHWGFSEKSRIFFVTRDARTDHESLKCKKSPCYYYSSKWELPWSRAMEARVRRTLRSTK